MAARAGQVGVPLCHERRGEVVAGANLLDGRFEESRFVSGAEDVVVANRGLPHAGPGLRVDALDLDVVRGARVEDVIDQALEAVALARSQE